MEESILKYKGVQEYWTFLKKEIFKAQGKTVILCHKMRQQGIIPTWLTRELFLRLRKKTVYHVGKEGQAT